MAEVGIDVPLPSVQGELLHDDLTEEELALDAEVAHLPEPPRENRAPWERQIGETSRGFHAFTHFRAQTIHSCLDAYKEHRQNCLHLSIAQIEDAPKHWRVWSSHWGWVDRAAAWDAELDRRVRVALMAQQVEAQSRHAREAQAIQAVLMIPVQAALAAANTPAFVQALTAEALASVDSATALVALVTRVGSVLPGVVQMERLALGLSSEVVGHEDRDDALSFADRIANDPAATEMAIHLLDQLTSPRESPALGAGASGEPGHVEDGAPSEPAHAQAR